jgi:hypothetical protein
MRGKNTNPAKPHLIPVLCASEDTEEQVVELGSGLEEVAPLDGPAGDEDESR